MVCSRPILVENEAIAAELRALMKRLAGTEFQGSEAEFSCVFGAKNDAPGAKWVCII